MTVNAKAVLKLRLNAPFLNGNKTAASNSQRFTVIVRVWYKISSKVRDMATW